MATEKQTTTRIEELEYAIRGYLNQIRATRTDLADPSRARREIESHNKRAEWHLQCAAAVENRLAHGDEIIEHAQHEIAKLRKRVKVIKHRRELERLKELQAQINELLAETPTCGVTLFYGEGKTRVCGAPAVDFVRHEGKYVPCCEECRSLRAAGGDIPFWYRGKARKESSC